MKTRVTGAICACIVNVVFSKKVAESPKPLKMSKTITFWLIWLLAWGASGSHAQQCAQAGNQVVVHSIQGSCGSSAAAVPGQAAACQQAQTTTTTTYIQQATITTTGTATIRSITVTPGYATVALHEFVYQNDFTGFREKMKSLDNRESLPMLVGALQSTDDKGMTVVHLLACAGRSEELLMLTQAVAKQKEHLGQLPHNIFKRVVFESLSLNATCTTCRPVRAEFEVVPHVQLALTNPQQTVFLYGNVTPLECAAAHGHVKAMKLLMQQGVAPGRVLMVAQHFGLGNQLLEAVGQAKAEGGIGAELHPDLPQSLDAPMRKPRQRRADRKAKSKPESGAGSSSTSPKQPQQTTQQQQHGSCSAQPQQHNQCTAQPQQHSQCHVQQQQASCSAQQQQASCSAQPQQHASCSAQAAQGKCNAQPQQHGSCKAQPPILQKTPDTGVSKPGGPAHIIGTVSTSILGVRVSNDQDPNKPARTPTKLSEAMDVTALWLLSSMLLFPAWSTLCLVWRKTVKRRAALQESAAKVKRTVAKPFQRRSSSGSTPAAAATAVVPPAAAEAAHPAPQRSSGSDSKQTNKASAAATKQQRKPGPSGTVAGPSVEPRAPTKAGWFRGLFRAKSAPEAVLKSSLKSNPGGVQGGSAAVRRQASTAAAVTSARAAPAAAAAGGAVLSSLPSSTAAAAAAGKIPAEKCAAAPSSKDKSSTVSSTVVAASSSGPTAATQASSKQQRSSKPAGVAAAASVAPAKAKEGSKGSSGKATNSSSSFSKKLSSAVSSAAGDSSSSREGAAAQRVAGQPQKGDSSSRPDEIAAPPAAAKQPKVLFRSSKVESTGSGPTAATPGSSSTQQPAVGSVGHRAAVPAAAAAARTVGSSSSTHNTTTATPVSPAATKQGRNSPSEADSFSLNSPTSSSRAGHFAGGVRKVHTVNSTVSSPPGRAPPCSAHSVVSPSGSSGSGSKRFTVSAAAAAAAAVRDAAAAAAAATASIQRPASRSASLSPRAPLMDLYDVLARCRDQDQHRAYAALAATEGAQDTAAEDDGEEASVPSGNAWTPAAAAARAARAGGEGCSSKGHLPNADSESQSESGAAEAAAGAAGDAAQAATVRPAAAAAEGVLPNPDDAASAANAAVPRTVLSAQDSSLNAAEAAAATAYAAAVSVLPTEAGMEAPPKHDSSSRGHAPAALDPPVSLLPADLMRSLDGASGGPVPRSASALEPRVVQDLADLVAASIAQEVARGKQANEQQGSPAAAAAAGAAAGETAGAAAGASSADLSSAQLVHKSLDEVFAQLTANSSMPGSQQQSSAQQLPTLQEQPSAAAAAGQQEVCRDFHNFSGSNLFGDLARISIGRHSTSDPEQPQQLQQLDMQVPPPGQQPAAQQQQQPGGWFASATAGAMSGPMQAAAGPPGLLADVHGHAMHAMNSMDMTAMNTMNMSGPMSGPPGLQLPAGSAVLSAQSMTAMQQQVAAQQQGRQQQGMQQHLVRPMLVNVNAGQQPMQVQQLVNLGPAAAGGALQGPPQLIRLANGQVVQGHIIAMPDRQAAAGAGPHLSMPVPPVVAGSHTNGPLIIAQGNGMNMNMQQQHMNMSVMGPQQQQQQAQVVQVFYPQALVQGGGVSGGQMVGSVGAAGGQVRVMSGSPQQQQVMMNQPQVVNVQMPGGVIQAIPVSQLQMSGISAPSSGPMMMQPGHMVMSSGQVQQQVAGRTMQCQQQQVQGIQRAAQMFAHGSPDTSQSGHNNLVSMSSSPARSSLASRPQVAQAAAVGASAQASQQLQQAGGSGGGETGGQPGAAAACSSGGSSSSSSARVTVLEAPAGPGAGPSQAAAVARNKPGPGNGANGGWADALGGIWARPTERAQMAAELDELLDQANQEMGWSSLPKGQGPAGAQGNGQLTAARAVDN